MWFSVLKTTDTITLLNKIYLHLNSQAFMNNCNMSRLLLLPDNKWQFAKKVI